ncbi:MAG: M56 family metallopeptidase [Ruminiclostridium sp.]|nr:M56 family metallopeptidase [Ruminiclostridium sp.]
MDQFCTTLLTMSLTASVTALVVMVLRLFLKKVPRKLVCLLWLAVFFRMVCPVSFEAPVSLMPPAVTEGTLVQQVILPEPDPTPQAADPIQTEPAPPAKPAPAPTLPAAPAETEPAVSWSQVLFCLWSLGCGGMVLWAAVSYRRLTRRTTEAIRLEENIYLSDAVETPFVCGLKHPRIYLPVTLDQADIPHVLRHERAHIDRLDHIAKPLAWLALCLHWFNPILWLAYRLLCRDMEAACDQAATKDATREDTADYAAALLHVSWRPSPPAAVPLAFGEENPKHRIEALLRYQRPAFWVVLLAGLACAALLLLLAADPKSDTVYLEGNPISQSEILQEGNPFPLPREQTQELVRLLKWTHRGSYTPCDQPALPDGAVTLSHPDAAISYHVILEGPEAPRLVKEQGGTFRSAPLSMEVNNDASCVREWSAWWDQTYALTGYQDADALFALQDGDPQTILEALPIQDYAGSYTFQLYEDWKGYALVLDLETQPASDTQRQLTDWYLTYWGEVFLALSNGHVREVSWFYPDGWGSLTTGLPELYDQEGFRTLYAQRQLWWTDAICLNSTYYSTWPQAHYRPAFQVAEVLYQAPDLGGYDDLDDLAPARSSVVFHPDFLAHAYGTNSSSAHYPLVYQPLEDFTVPSPDDPAADLLAGRGIQTAYRTAAPDLEAKDPMAHLTPSGYGIYVAQDGVYLANWQTQEGQEDRLMYLLWLTERPYSHDLYYVVEHVKEIKATYF